MRYVSIEDCQRIVFPYIHRFLSTGEAAPDYEREESAMLELTKVLALVQDDTYYPSIVEKAAYLISGLAGSQYFSNGNKRLGVTTLLTFFALNRAELLDRPAEGYRELLRSNFPLHVWEENLNIGGAHSLFLYNLAIVIGDRSQWGVDDFGGLRQRVAAIFAELYQLTT